MKIIDFKKKGNAVRFFLGHDDLKEWWGDDWDDTPYEYNAGQVYDEYAAGHSDVFFKFDDIVLEPSDGTNNSEYSKQDMINRMVPCIIVMPKELAEDSWYSDFQHWVGAAGIKKYYFGDEFE